MLHQWLLQLSRSNYRVVEEKQRAVISVDMLSETNWSDRCFVVNMSEVNIVFKKCCWRGSLRWITQSSCYPVLKLCQIKPEVKNKTSFIWKSIFKTLLVSWCSVSVALGVSVLASSSRQVMLRQGCISPSSSSWSPSCMCSLSCDNYFTILANVMWSKVKRVVLWVDLWKYTKCSIQSMACAWW